MLGLNDRGGGLKRTSVLEMLGLNDRGGGLKRTYELSYLKWPKFAMF